MVIHEVEILLTKICLPSPDVVRALWFNGYYGQVRKSLILGTLPCPYLSLLLTVLSTSLLTVLLYFSTKLEIELSTKLKKLFNCLKFNFLTF